MKLLGTLNWVSVIALGITLFIIIARWLSKLKDKYLKSDIIKTLIFKDQLITISHVFHSGGDGGDAYRHTRLTWVNMLSGKILHKQVVDEELDFYFHQHNILLLKTSNMYHGFDLSTSKKIFDRHFLFEIDASIKAEKIAEIHFNQEAFSFSITTLKGNKKTISSPQWMPAMEKDPHSMPPSTFGFKKSSNDSFFYISYLGEQAPQATGLLNAVKLVEEDHQLYLKHADTLDENSLFFISRADVTGKLNWSITNQQLGIKHHSASEQPAQINFVYLYKNILVMVVNAKRDLMLGLNTQTGQLSWKKTV